LALLTLCGGAQNEEVTSAYLPSKLKKLIVLTLTETNAIVKN